MEMWTVSVVTIFIVCCLWGEGKAGVKFYI